MNVSHMFTVQTLHKHDNLYITCLNYFALYQEGRQQKWKRNRIKLTITAQMSLLTGDWEKEIEIEAGPRFKV